MLRFKLLRFKLLRFKLLRFKLLRFKLLRFKLLRFKLYVLNCTFYIVWRSLQLESYAAKQWLMLGTVHYTNHYAWDRALY